MQRIKDLTPNLAVNDVATSVRFYTEVLGFELRMAVSEDRQMAQGGLQEGVRYVWAYVYQVAIFLSPLFYAFINHCDALFFN